MINKQVTKTNVIDALKEIDKNGVPKKREATKFNLYYEGKSYPPKYVLSIATKISSGKELEAAVFNGGVETNSFLISLGFIIREGSNEFKKKVNPDSIRICSAVIQIPKRFEGLDPVVNEIKLEILEQTLLNLKKDTDILILPAGFVRNGKGTYKILLPEIEGKIKELLKKYTPNLTICMGIDGKSMSEELAFAINVKGIISLARKFHHYDDSVILSKSSFEKEETFERFFKIKNKIAYLAVCYDSFGISQRKIVNPKFDFIINVIHVFGKGYYGGDVDFARKGLAGAAKQWNVHVYASSFFVDRNPENWPSGVQWTHGMTSVRELNYNDIKIKAKEDKVELANAIVHLRYYQE